MGSQITTVTFHRRFANSSAVVDTTDPGDDAPTLANNSPAVVDTPAPGDDDPVGSSKGAPHIYIIIFMLRSQVVTTQRLRAIGPGWPLGVGAWATPYDEAPPCTVISTPNEIRPMSSWRSCYGTTTSPFCRRRLPFSRMMVTRVLIAKGEEKTWRPRLEMIKLVRRTRCVLPVGSMIML